MRPNSRLQNQPEVSIFFLSPTECQEKDWKITPKSKSLIVDIANDNRSLIKKMKRNGIAKEA
ncbi:MAG: hypothetical protein A2Y14_01135 [Verrucomicrobia bacterium GWF2_51_19]|nr:MAG: hypothetical protein A2Y14_01135 [Verrucomicrobia bacterium GWF2_51_19]